MPQQTAPEAPHVPAPSWSVWVGRQLLLVPESVLLLTLLCMHAMLGAPLLTALIGLGLIGCFVCRTTLMHLARQALKEANYARADRLSRLALALYPYSADAQGLRAALFMARGQTKAAEEALRRAIAYYPYQAVLYAALSGVLIEDNRPIEAQWAATHALVINPRCALAHLHLAQVAQQLNAAPAIIEQHLRNGLHGQAEPSEEAALRCALAALLLNQGRQSEAQFILVGAEALLARCPAPQRASLHYHLGELRRTIGDLDAARNHFSASETLDPHGPWAAAAWRAARS